MQGSKAPKTPWQTPAPAFPELATPQTAVATAGWQEIYDEDDTKEGALSSLQPCCHAPDTESICMLTLTGQQTILVLPTSLMRHEDSSSIFLAIHEMSPCRVKRVTSTPYIWAAHSWDCVTSPAEGGELPEGGKPEEVKEWVDDGSLPLEDDKLPFFLLDAHEEPATPGTLYLFGKVWLSHSQ